MATSCRTIWWDTRGAAGNPINRLDGSFNVPNSGTSTGWEWNNLKKVNYFLRHCFNASGPMADIERYAAEAYFFKAWDYYKKLAILGEVPWLTSDLNVDSPELYAPRTPPRAARRLDPLVSGLRRGASQQRRQCRRTHQPRYGQLPQSPLLPFRGHLPQISQDRCGTHAHGARWRRKVSPCMRGSLRGYHELA